MALLARNEGLCMHERALITYGMGSIPPEDWLDYTYKLAWDRSSPPSPLIIAYKRQINA